MTIIGVATTISGLFLGLGLILAFLRLVRGPTISDRVVALDLITTMGIGVIAAYALVSNDSTFLDIAILLAVLSFLGTVAFAYYVERRT